MIIFDQRLAGSPCNLEGLHILSLSQHGKTMPGGGRPGPRLRCNELARVPLKGQPGRFWARPTMLDAFCDRWCVGVLVLGYNQWGISEYP